MTLPIPAAPPAALPESLREIALHCGLDAALQLVATHGGTEICVPTHARCRSAAALVQLIGDAAARALIRSYPGSRLSIPRCAEAKRALRDQAIIDAYTARVSVRDLARQHEITTRQVRTILKRVPEAERVQIAKQLSLF